MLLYVLTLLLSLATTWMIFKKMGREGWEGLVPVYNLYVICEELYGNGWKILGFLIPFYNIYLIIKLYIDFAKAFHKGIGFALGLACLPFVFQIILAFGDAQFGYYEMENTTSDFVSKTVESTKAALKNACGKSTADELKKYKELLDMGALTEEEFTVIKKDLLGF